MQLREGCKLGRYYVKPKTTKRKTVYQVYSQENKNQLGKQAQPYEKFTGIGTTKEKADWFCDMLNRYQPFEAK